MPPFPGHSKSFDEITASGEWLGSSAAIRRPPFASRLLKLTVYTNRTIIQCERDENRILYINLKSREREKVEKKSELNTVELKESSKGTSHVGTRFSSRYTHKFQAENVDEIGGTP